MNKFSRLFITVVIVGVLASITQAQLVWTGSVANISWDTTSPNWSNGTASALFGPGSNVVFNDAALMTTVNITGPVSPGSVIITNNTKVFIFTNDVITGNGGIVKAGSGAAYFGGSPTNLYAYSASHSFTGGTTVLLGSLNYYLANTNDGARAGGGTAFGFGTGPITLGATNASFKFTGFQGSSLLTNNLEVVGGGDAGSHSIQYALFPSE